MLEPDWVQVTDTPSMVQIAVPPGLTTLWALSNEPNDNVYYLGANGWVLAPGQHLTYLAAVVDGMVWGVDATQSPSVNNIFFYSDGRWIQPVHGYLTSISIGLDGDIWGVNGTQPETDSSNIYR